MIESDTLLTLAQLAAGLIGVSAIISVFLARGETHEYDRWRFAMIVLVGMLTMFGAFLPIWVERLLSEPEAIWRSVSFISVAVMVMFTVPSVRLAPREHALAVLSRSVVRSVYMAALPLLAALAVSFHIANAIGWPLAPNQFLYEAAMFTGLVQMAVYFVDLTIFRPA